MDASAYDGFEVFGASIAAFMHGFRQYPTLLEKYFTRYGLGTYADLSDPSILERWVSMGAWLRSTHGIVDEIGGSTVYAIGKRIPDNALIPPEVDSAAKILSSADVVYHLHHRPIGGVPMFDPATGTMAEGIGNYRCEILPGDASAHVYCDNPYPCDLDRGIVTGLASKFEPAVSVTHVGSECRKKGDAACTYLVQW